MKYSWIAALMVVAVGHAQTAPAMAPPQGTTQDVSADRGPAASLVVPQGTLIPLTLVSQIRSKSTKPGDSVRAQVAFPVTVGTQVAIPAGTYVEGMVQSVNVKASAPQARVQIHFTRLLFANGYGVTLDAINQQAKLRDDSLGTVAAAGAGPLDGVAFFEGQQSYPTPPPLPRVGPPMGPIIGGSLGAVGVLLVVGAIMHHHNGNADYILFDDGWQFQMTLASPLTLDEAKVAASR